MYILEDFDAFTLFHSINPSMHLLLIQYGSQGQQSKQCRLPTPATSSSCSRETTKAFPSQPETYSLDAQLLTLSPSLSSSGEEPPEEESSFPATSFFQSLPRTCWGVWRNVDVDSSVNQYSALALPQQTGTAPLSPRSWTGLWDTWTPPLEAATPPWPEMGISLISSWEPRLQTMRC